MQKTKEEIAQELVPMINEAYRLNEFVKEILPMISSEKLQRRGVNQVSRFEKGFYESLKKIGYEVVDFKGMKYEPGMPVNPINIADFGADEELYIEVVIEPVVKKIKSSTIINNGVVVLGGKKV